MPSAKRVRKAGANERPSKAVTSPDSKEQPACEDLQEALHVLMEADAPGSDQDIREKDGQEPAAVKRRNRGSFLPSALQASHKDSMPSLECSVPPAISHSIIWPACTLASGEAI